MATSTIPTAARPLVRFIETPQFQRDADEIFSESELRALRVHLAIDPWAGYDAKSNSGPMLVWGKGQRAVLIRYLVHVLEGAVLIILTSVHRPGPDGGADKDAAVSPVIWKKVREYGIVLTLKKVADIIFDKVKEVIAGG